MIAAAFVDSEANGRRKLTQLTGVPLSALIRSVAPRVPHE